MRRRSVSTRSVDTVKGKVTVWTSDVSLEWERSPRIAGKLSLRSLPHRRVNGRVPFYVPGEYGAGVPVNAGGFVSNQFYGVYPENQVPTTLSNEVYARFRGKLYKGNAALGVTAASYKQSRDMIVNRYATLTNRAGAWAEKLGSLNGRRLEKQVAGLHLEVIFGWTPLLSDIHAATTTVIQNVYPVQFVSSRAKTPFAHAFTRHEGDVTHSFKVSGTYSETWSAAVKVSNPNLWLAERAGLLNPAAIAWDLVPWSFVVNMFVNTGQLVNSVTDFAGLTFENFSRTRTTDFAASIDATRRYLGGSLGSTVHLRNTKQRELLTGPPRPRLEFQLPELSWSTVSMAASLFTQKFAKIGNFIKPSQSYRRA